MRQEIEGRQAEDESIANLLRESEAKIDHWRVGLENSYQQKRVLKEAMKQVLETNTHLQEKNQRERTARRCLERQLMAKEDEASMLTNTKEEEGFEEEFGSFDWGRRVRR